MTPDDPLSDHQLCTGILGAVGSTPLVPLKRVVDDAAFRLWGKVEGLNPGGSIKDRAALSIMGEALRKREIGAGTTVIESSSGNMGIGLAQACLRLGLRFICVVDPKTTAQNLLLLRSYGAEVDMVREPDPASGEFLQARLNRVRALRAAIADSFWPNQYANLANARAHEATAREILAGVAGELDYLFCTTSTCGTLRGCAQYLREHSPRTQVVAVDAVGSVIFGGGKGRRLIPGHGAGVVPPLFRASDAHQQVSVSDLDCVVGCRRLVRREAILAGGSSGAAIAAVARLRATIPRDANCVVVLPDRGERYLDTIYCDEWVESHFGLVSHLWQDNVKEAHGAR
jgi:cysteine synthase A